MSLKQKQQFIYSRWVPWIIFHMVALDCPNVNRAIFVWGVGPTQVQHVFFKRQFPFWALLLKGQKGGGQSEKIPVMQPSTVITCYWPG